MQSFGWTVTYEHVSPECVVSSQSQGHGEGDLYGHGKAGYEDLERRGPGEAARGLIFNGCV